MTRTLLLAAALFLPMAGQAAEMPKELRGNWCITNLEHDGWFRQCREGDDLVIEQDAVHGIDEDCTPLQVRKGNTWIVREHCKVSDLPIWRKQTTHYTLKDAYLILETK